MPTIIIVLSVGGLFDTFGCLVYGGETVTKVNESVRALDVHQVGPL